MAFWRSETMRERMPAEQLIQPYREQHIKTSAYELGMGNQAFITSTTDKVKKELDDGESLCIPPGQFALLLTEERIKVPLNAIAFISMKFGYKRRGLINVSGFHVDPGFEGRLKFSVYNAGSSPITITQGDRVFLIWYADLDGTTTDAYRARPHQDTISSDDQNVMHGEIASPAELKSQIQEVKGELKSQIQEVESDMTSKIEGLTHLGVNIKLVVSVFLTLVGAILLRLLFMSSFAVPDSDDIESVRKDILIEVRQELSQFEKQNAAPISSPATTGEKTSDDQPVEQDDVGGRTQEIKPD